jgi:hypothetical protein
MWLRILSFLAFSVFSTPSAWAYYGVLDNGEILAPGHYKVTGDLQALTEEGGLNGAARFDLGFQDEYGVRALIGAGTTDIFFGGLFKWMPIPDTNDQPAIGFNVGLLYGKDGGERDLTIRWEPLISKKFDLHTTVWTPYASLPIGLRMRDRGGGDNNSYVAWQVVAGSQLQLAKWKNLQFIAEVGANLDNALSHVSVGAIFYFDQQRGFVLE